MNRKIEYLNPTRLLVDEVVEWLCGSAQIGATCTGRVRLCDGAKSLAHVMVIVPTAQSGRNLRLALARAAAERGWGALIPPRVVEPMALIKSANPPHEIASQHELCAAFLCFVGETKLSDFPHLFSSDIVGDYRAQLAFFDQLMDIWRILARGGFTMSDVPVHEKARAFFEQNMCGDEAMRWNELADFESRFFERLHALNRCHHVEDMRAAREDPAPISASIEEVVLPMLVDPAVGLYDVLAHQRDDLSISVLIQCSPAEAGAFDDWGRPRIEAWTGANRPVLSAFTAADIIRTGTDVELAQHLSADFPAPDEARRRPSLGLCDESLFPELAAAFLNRGYVLHNPERYRLTASSLGRILVQLVDLYAARHEFLPWKPFVALLREDDVLSAVTRSLSLPQRALVLEGVDVCQNCFLPRVLPADLAFDEAAVSWYDRPSFTAFLAAGRTLVAMLCTAWGAGGDRPPAEFLRRVMQSLFDSRALTGSDGEKEFRAAIDAVRDVLSAFETSVITTLNLREGAVIGLLRKALSDATYSLEPTARHSVRTEGWLELMWSAADKLALAGFSDGVVPDSVVGHPFVPDALREALGVTSNAARLARDTMILCNLVRSRASVPGCVRAYLSMTNAAGDQRHPSPLLFLVASDQLAARAHRLFGDLPPGRINEARRIEPKWRISLPLGCLPLRSVSEACPEGRLSASAIDQWLNCPFTYLLRYGLGMEHVVEKTELEANDFGSLIHGVLEDYANEQLSRSKKGLDQLVREEEIAVALARLVKARREAFGAQLPLKLQLQFDAAEGRLRSFARIQAFWAAKGWRIAEKPEYHFEVRPFAGEGVCDLPFKGSIDRIDYKPGVGYRLIDYKTWDLRTSAKKHVVCGGESQIAFAERLRLPRIASSSARLHGSRFVSVQLLLYAHCLECTDTRFAGHIADCCYAILGRTDQDVVVFGSSLDQGAFDACKRSCDRMPLLDHLGVALDTVRTAIRRIRAGIYWPTGPDDIWKRDFSGLFMFSPERDLGGGTPWRDEQEAKLKELEARA